MQVIMGIAPSEQSAQDDNGISEPWCPKALSGKKVRMLADPQRLHFANAVDEYPGFYINGRGRKVDIEPKTEDGFRRLIGFVDVASVEVPVEILLCGWSYWEGVLGMTRREKRLSDDQIIRIGRQVEVQNSAGAITAKVFPFPHPYHWPDPAGYSRLAYRAWTKAVLAKLEESPFDQLGEGEIDTVFSRFGLGHDNSGSGPESFAA